VPFEASSRQVLVGGDLLDGGHATVPYAASVKDFIAARRWDYQCPIPVLDSGPSRRTARRGQPSQCAAVQRRFWCTAAQWTAVAHHRADD